jgi:probable HAF family extracellular repeat protein
MTKRPPMLIAAAISCALAFAASAQASAHYPYTLIDPGTLGGPNSFFDGPGVPIASNGTLVGAADTTTLCPPQGGCFPPDPYVQHAFTWHDGKLTDLGALPGENTSAIWELNSHGIGAGNSTDGLVDPFTGGTGGVAVVFYHGQVISLGTLPGGQVSFAQDINNQGQVAGNSSNGTPDPYSLFGWGTETRAFVWRNGVMHDLGTLGGDDAFEGVQNERGQIAGQSYTNDTPNADSDGSPTLDPFLWQNGHMIDLGTLGGDYGNTSWLNDSGEVVGYSSLAGDNTIHPFLWNGRRMIDLGTLGGENGFANWVSDSGDVAGWAQTADDSWNGVLWHDGKILDLPPVDGAPWSFANSVNDEDQVVGNTTDTSDNELDAVLWAGGHAYDLNTLVAPSAVQLTAAQYINDQGDIVSNAVLPNGDQHIVLLVRNPSVPLPNASTVAAPLADALNAAGPLTSDGVADASPTAEFAVTAARYGIKAGIHQLMRDIGH